MNKLIKAGIEKLGAVSVSFRDLNGGVNALVTFDNGYGASVIRSQLSYGGSAGLFELAVIDDNGLTYDTPVTDDVLGYLTPEDVINHLKEIQGLQAPSKSLGA